MSQTGLLSNKVYVMDLGVAGVGHTEEFMTQIADLRAEDLIADILLFVTHPKTVTVGLKDRNSSIPKDLLVTREELRAQGIEFTGCIRGGGITYHWPGQIVCCPIMLLDQNARNISKHMEKLEQVGILTFRSFGLDVSRRRDTAAHIGLWLGSRKIMSMGIKVSRWVTSFGFAVNVQGDFSQSKYVRPCGIEGACLTTLEEVLGTAPSREQVIQAICENFAQVFEREPIRRKCPVMENCGSNEPILSIGNW